VVVGDPASGVVTWSLALFRQACSGNFLVFGAAPTPEIFSRPAASKYR
jgi:hypothetical protein